MRTALSLVLAASMFAVACGGEAPTPKPPESEPVGAADSGADMPPPAPTAAAVGGESKTPEATPGVPDPKAESKPMGLGLPTATVKIALKGKKTANLELKSDGTVTNGGKDAAKITPTEVQDKDGKALLSVSGDAVSTPSGTSVAKFEGDDLVGAKGDKLSMADDGTLTWTASGGKGAPAGKVDGGGSAKRATVLAAWFVISPPPAEKAPAKVPGEKPAGGDKPAGGKPAGKPAKK